MVTHRADHPLTSLVLLAAASALLAGCGAEAPAPAVSSPPAATEPQPSAPPPLSELPVQLTVGQRSTTPIPGSSERLSITIDDITRGQTIVSLMADSGTVVLAPASMRPRDSRRFKIDDFEYSLELTQLVNQLVGDDSAMFTITAALAQPEAAPSLTETEKIDRLIEAVAAAKDVVFVRNGEEHSPQDAADHLRRKRESAGGGLTAREFIDTIASRSSLTGEEYEIRWPDGRTQPAREFLQAELSRLEGPSAAPPVHNESTAATPPHFEPLIPNP